MNPWVSAHEKLAELEAAAIETRKVVAELVNGATEEFQFESAANIAGNLSRATAEIGDARVYASHVLNDLEGE